ncbi:MAG TPA: DUF1998 domain-containing protein [Methanoregulaceae archaeon]|nr:MAG: DUF1998 domain-containing protein [Methanolinea sp.]HON81862.1 DUF1998 domain-containing protein [Methanoregulaceae archaeon]HPD10632.1 DUF1998 domain-containing protein [Methanoregulaceae archaeon]HRT15763.1 DUF1998 domain-containing protein [Methanoregulaceae archaeon]HRU31277.1 DUF1998 domain-containing protein [Methanoregulaceae archaeon]
MKIGKKFGIMVVALVMLALAFAVPASAVVLSEKELGVYWDELVKTDPDDRAEYIRILARGSLKETLKNLNLTPESLTRMIEERLEDFHRDEMLNLKYEEYKHLIAGFDIGQDDDGDFEIRNVEVPDEIRPYFRKIVRVVRLHEVITLRGFTRINPCGDENDRNIVPLSLNATRWLPAIEVRGEGIFMEFNPTTLRCWEQQERIRLRAEAIQERWQREWNKRFEGRSTPLLTPRYFLVHTWAHALMRQLTLECGYSSASLRERIYVSDDSGDMAGVLIYTATSDSDGTLGGLQRQGEAARISPTVRAAIRDMEWCSSDPLCIEQVIAPPEHYSGSACHACCLAPETSCEQYNRFLDRAMLVGLPDDRGMGYFSDLLREVDDGGNVAPRDSR